MPLNWGAKKVRDIVTFINGKAHEHMVSPYGRYSLVTSKFISTGGKEGRLSEANYCPAQINDLLMVMSDIPNGKALAKCFFVEGDVEYAVNQRICILRAREDAFPKWLYYVINRHAHYLSFDDGVKQTNLRKDDVLSCEILVPPTLAEQEAISNALSDADAYIESLEKLIEKKRQIKKGAMQELLTGKRRLPEFSGEWSEKSVVEVAEILDHLRVPLNDSERIKMRGDYPYCGANGILDHINDYCIDDSVILIAEDGGHFEEYQNRPIAYRMSGRFWVNNHAHILKSKSGCCQDFLFHSIVHKNILSFLASGTRAKLNKSELEKIAIYQPVSEIEQKAIASILNEIVTEIDRLESKLSKARLIKQGMMQELLTGRIRLV